MKNDRFIIMDVNPLLAKAKYTKLSKQESLQAFVELACYGTTEHPRYLDASDSYNRAEAEKWFFNELTFLEKRDAKELRDIWDHTIENGDCSRRLFSAIKVLQDKYV